MKKRADSATISIRDAVPSERVGMLVLSTTWGGAETVVMQLLRRLEARGISTALFVNDELLPHFGTNAALHSTAIYPLGPLAANNTAAHAYRTARIHGRLRNAIAASHIEVLHAHLERSLFALAVGVRRQQVPVIFTLHGGDSEHYKTPVTAEHRAMVGMMRRMLRDQSGQYTVTSCARWQLQQFEAELRPQIIYIPNGVDTGLFTPGPASDRPRKDVILFVGRYAEQKGIQYLREAAERLPKYSFWFAGRGPMASVMTLANMKDHGFKTSEQLVPLFRKATICVFPSLYEALPLVGLEAMASGKSIIATPLGFTEYLKDGKNGLVVPMRDSERLTKAIDMLMKDTKKRTCMEKAARATALDYEWEDIMDEYVKLYARTAQRWRSQGRRA